MRIKGGGRVMVEVPRRQLRREPDRQQDWYRDAFEVAPMQVVSRRLSATMAGVLRDLAEQGRARLAEDLRERDRAQLLEVGRILGGLRADVVVEVINHFAQRAAPVRAAPMVVLGALIGALLVETTPELDERDAGRVLEKFVTFLEETEGQPTRRLVGTLYALG